MIIPTLQFVSILITAIGMAGSWAHLLALANKMKLPREEYLIAQKIYRGWSLLGVAAVIALVSTAALAVLQREEGAAFYFAVAASVCIALGLVIFFAVTFPANKATKNWTVLPTHWESLRQRWEYSHAVGAILYFLALASLCVSVFSSECAMC